MNQDTKPTEGAIAAAREFIIQFDTNDSPGVAATKLAEIIQRLAVAPVEKERDEAQIKCAEWQHRERELTRERDELRAELDRAKERGNKWRECAVKLKSFVSFIDLDIPEKQELREALAEFERLEKETAI